MHEDDRSHGKRDDANAQASASAYHPTLPPWLAIAWPNGSRRRIRPTSAARSVCCVAIRGSLGAGERGDFLWRVCESRTRVRSALSRSSSSTTSKTGPHRHRKPLLSSFQLGPKTPSCQCHIARPRGSLRSHSSSSCSSRRPIRCALCQPTLRHGLALPLRRVRTSTSLGDRAFL